MAKDPAFLFYSADFLIGTQFFTDEQVGKYIRLLTTQHQQGHLTEKQMVQICKGRDEDIFSKFLVDNEGKFYNQRLEQEYVKRKNYSESRAKNRTNPKKDMLIISDSYEKHMVNENENINEIINKDTLERGVGENLSYRIEDCFRIALADPRWVKANKANEAELQLFNEYLERLGKYDFNPKDYKQYFAKLKGKYPDLLKKEYSTEELRAMAKEIDKQNLKAV